MAFCPNCSTEVAADALKCPQCEAMFGASSAWRPSATRPDAALYVQGKPLYFAVSCSKLAVLAVVTFGLYVIYWFYRNWKMEQQRAGRGWPLLLTALCPLTAYLLFDSIRSSLVRHSLPKIDAGLLALSFFALNLGSRFPDPYWILAVLSFVPILFVQAHVNKLNSQLAPDAPPNDRYSGANIAVVVVGALVWLLVLAGMFLPDPNGAG